jgi:hypothetical protein
VLHSRRKHILVQTFSVAARSKNDTVIFRILVKYLPAHISGVLLNLTSSVVFASVIELKWK